MATLVISGSKEIFMNKEIEGGGCQSLGDMSSKKKSFFIDALPNSSYTKACNLKTQIFFLSTVLS